VIPLPIDPHLPATVAELARAGTLVLVAPPGSGKTTRLPRALLDAGTVDGEIVVLEPRRLAARLAARRVADELGDELGGAIGFQTRFEDVRSGRTRLRFVTEGILTRRLLADPDLRGVGAVILDEVHERHLVGDMALALLARLRRTRRADLRIVAMSATLDAAPLAKFLGAAIVEVPGRAFPVDVEHLGRTDDRPLELQVAAAVRRLAREGPRGDVLVFLPGAREIRRARDACAAVSRDEDLLVVELHGSLSAAEQDRALRPADRRKVILSTNVAESSVTIEGVVAVVDSGLANVASHAPWSGMPVLRTAKIARASAEQRAGRAGRTAPGRALRLYTSGDLQSRPAHDAPEIARADLAEPLLELIASGVEDPRTFEWLEAPPAASVDAGIELLRRLGAVEGEATELRATDDGRRMLRFPLHPRLARVVVEGERLGVAAEAATAAALLAERSIRASGPGAAWDGPSERSDLAPLAAELEAAERGAPERLRSRGLDPLRVASARRAAQQIRRAARDRAPSPASSREAEDALLRALMTGFPDRLGRARRPEGSTGRAGIEIVFADGGSASLAPSSAVRDAAYVLALDAEERGGASSRPVVRLASAVEPDWILEAWLDRVADEASHEWSAQRGRVERVRRLRLGQLVLEETRDLEVDARAAAGVLAGHVAGRGGLALGDAARDLLARAELVRGLRPDLELPVLDEAALIARACEGRTTLKELEGVDWAAIAASALSAEQARALRELAPERVRLGAGREVKVHYEAGKPPSVASRLQDFFGLTQGPTVGGGRVPLVLHLRAPNHRDVQVTTDLAGFWDRHYPAIAKELRRRYPRHAWPDDPRTASPPAPRR
jgi:ATP-dependent helicase HrpB